VGAGDSGRYLRRLRAGLPPRYRRRDRAWLARATVISVAFLHGVIHRADYQKPDSSTALQADTSAFSLPNRCPQVNMLKARFGGRFWLLHVGTATRSVRQYRAQMARTGGASAGTRYRTSRQRPLATLLHAGGTPRGDARDGPHARRVGKDRRRRRGRGVGLIAAPAVPRRRYGGADCWRSPLKRC